MQEFEKYKTLAKHIERMACNGNIGNTHEWSHFLFELNTCLMISKPRIKELEDKLQKKHEQIHEIDTFIMKNLE
jgi:hypothetical protein